MANPPPAIQTRQSKRKAVDPPDTQPGASGKSKRKASGSAALGHGTEPAASGDDTPSTSTGRGKHSGRGRGKSRNWTSAALSLGNLTFRSRCRSRPRPRQKVSNLKLPISKCSLSRRSRFPRSLSIVLVSAHFLAHVPFPPILLMTCSFLEMYILYCCLLSSCILTHIAVILEVIHLAYGPNITSSEPVYSAVWTNAPTAKPNTTSSEPKYSAVLPTVPTADPIFCQQLYYSRVGGSTTCDLLLVGMLLTPPMDGTVPVTLDRTFSGV